MRTLWTVDSFSGIGSKNDNIPNIYVCPLNIQVPTSCWDIYEYGWLRSGIEWLRMSTSASLRTEDDTVIMHHNSYFYLLIMHLVLN